MAVPRTTMPSLFMGGSLPPGRVTADALGSLPAGGRTADQRRWPAVVGPGRSRLPPDRPTATGARTRPRPAPGGLRRQQLGRHRRRPGPGSFRRLGRINVVPDRAERVQRSRPTRTGWPTSWHPGGSARATTSTSTTCTPTRQAADRVPPVVRRRRRDLRTREIVWRFQVDGVRSDHMAISPDGRPSSSAPRQSCTRGSATAWRSPHESVFIDDGRRILHASIGMVYSPLDQPALDPTKQERVLPDRRRPDLRGPAPLRPAPGARRAGTHRRQHRRPADDAVAGREDGRTSSCRSSTASSRWTSTPATSSASSGCPT